MHSNMKRFLTGTLLLLLPVIASAADNVPSADTGGSQGLNVILIGLVSLIIVLLFVIGVAADVLRKLAIVWRDKNREAKRNSSNTIMKSLLLLGLVSGIANVAKAAEEAAAPAVNWSDQMISGMPAFDFYLIMGVIGLEFLVILSLLLFIRIMINIINAKPELEEAKKKALKIPFWDRFNQAVAIEKEQDVMLDHDYDGIKELDNSLPPWWKYGFYLTILIAIVYLWRFHVSGTGPSSHEEFVMEMEKAEREKAAYLAKSANNVDEHTVKLLTDASDLSAGQTIFEATCAACHSKDGGGGVGPNLTDNYWLHGGSIQDIFKSIKYGWQDKGMKSWKDDFSPKQIAQIASYVKELQGSKPAAPKDPQGEPYQEQTAPVSDTAGAVKDKVALN